MPVIMTKPFHIEQHVKTDFITVCLRAVLSKELAFVYVSQTIRCIMPKAIVTGPLRFSTSRRQVLIGSIPGLSALCDWPEYRIIGLSFTPLD